MAFKREGNDSGMLGNIKKRRVTDLLSEKIPDDEAFLMRNGRLCCMVCYHRPVFDTIDMLSIHRDGKKHQSCMEKFNAAKQELSALRRKREQEQYLKTGSASIPGAVRSEVEAGRFLGCKSYDPRVKKSKVTHDRKQVLQMNTDLYTAIPQCSSESSLPGNQSTPDTKPQTIMQYRQMKKHQNKEQINLRPYISKTVVQRPSQTFENQTNVQALEKVGETSKMEISQSAQYVHPQNVKPKVKKKEAMYGPTVNEQKVRKAEQYLQARGLSEWCLEVEETTDFPPCIMHCSGHGPWCKRAGWKKDLSGKWIRDEDAEFDSDEEPPDLP